MSSPLVAIVYLGRHRARGELARVRSWKAIVEDIGAEVLLVPLIDEHWSRAADALPFATGLARGQLAPESAMWSASSVRQLLDRTRPAAVVCVTIRAFHPLLVSRAWTTVLDQVDQLSRSYRERARIARSLPRRIAYRGAAATALRFERRLTALDIASVAAGFADAAALGAEWVPNVVAPLPDLRPDPSADDAVDVSFVGTLSYPPNVEAIRVLAHAWPTVLARRPGASALLAGATPIKSVRQLADQLGWQIHADFREPSHLYQRSRVAVVPLRTASGIQNKLLEAASFGVPLVASPQALLGFEPPFPAAVATSVHDLGQQILALLEDPIAATALGLSGRRTVEQTYSTPRWREPVARLLHI